MKISWNWLRELVKLPASLSSAPVLEAAKEVEARLIRRGVAVDALIPVGVGLSGAIVAEIRGKRPHPKADKLTLVDVFDGQAVTQVVCGAPNVPAAGEPGQSPRVIWAKPGATLPNGLTLSVRDVRGIPSPGMLCAEDELGLSGDHGGIVLLRPEDGLEIGSDFAQGAGLPDVIFELDITPNRPDLLGHLGVAREVAAAFASEGATLLVPEIGFAGRTAERQAGSAASIEITDATGCPRYLGHVLTGLRVQPSPIKERLLLTRLGARPINNIVDATNLAMFFIGQPLHAFDLNRLAGRKIIVRRARPEEKMTTLDDVVRSLSTDDLLIADSERGVAIAGVMGGRDSEVRADTTEVLLEAAYFDPATVRRSARRCKLHTEASHRFERGADPNSGLELGARYCADRLLALAGGQILSGAIDVCPRPQPKKTVELRFARTNQILGTEDPPVSRERQTAALTALGLSVEKSADDRATFAVPTYRPDLVREIDLIEEIGRSVGYNDIKERIPRLSMQQPSSGSAESGLTTPPPSSERARNAERARDLCVALGFDEVQLFSMTSPDKLRAVSREAFDESRLLPLENPLREDLSVLRTQLLPGLLDALRKNLHHGLSDVRLCEVGEVFLRPRDATVSDPAQLQTTRIAGVLCGHRSYYLKPGASDGLDFADVRGIVEELLDGLGYVIAPAAGHKADDQAAGREVLIRPASADKQPFLHPGLGAVVLSSSRVDADGSPALVGYFGEVHPELRKRLDLQHPALPALPVFGFEIDIPAFRRPMGTYHEPPRFPGTSRDLSFLIAVEVPADAIRSVLYSAPEPLLTDVRILEDYRHPTHIPAGQKGLLLSLSYRKNDRTLTDDEAQKAHERVLAHLQGAFAIKLR
ncbi:MAG TPA: phenylalanine--tRNA ligase subunit beta [Pseudomonadota bacterium]|nr:phenylalanine--tRNA ligase subunit beta [Pseudomonadota bacterium]